MTDKWYEIFIAGEYPQGNFSESYLDQVISNFERDKKAGVPITLDHIREGEAYGWVGGLKRVGKKLLASFSDVTDGLIEAVKAKKYKNVSSGFHPSEARLLEVSFLGAKLPQIKSLEPPTFSLPDDLLCIEFAEWMDDEEDDDMDEAAIFADYDDVTDLQQVCIRQLEEINYLKNQLETKTFSEDENYKVKFEESERLSLETDIENFCNDGLKQGYFLPRVTQKVKALMFATAHNNEVIEFKESESQEEPTKESAYNLLKAVLTDGEPTHGYLFQEQVTGKVNQRYDFSHGKEMKLSDIQKIARQKGIDPNDSIKMAELIKEISNQSQQNTINGGFN
jgi:hypothetical protein